MAAWSPRILPGALRLRRLFAVLIGILVLIGAMSVSTAAGSDRHSAAEPTIVLVHGAFADASSWNGVVERLQDRGHTVVAPANPLRGIAADSAYIASVVAQIEGPVLLVGHSYGGALLTNVAADAGEIVGLVFVAGYALEPGESCAAATGLAPGGTLLETLERVTLSDGSVDTYIAQDKYHRQFAEDLPEAQTKIMGVTQRPITEAALGEPSPATNPLWRSVPSYFIWGELDRNIPAAVHRIMADRAGSKRSVEIAGASHVVGMSHVPETVEIILEAANAGALAEA